MGSIHQYESPPKLDIYTSANPEILSLLNQLDFNIRADPELYMAALETSSKMLDQDPSAFETEHKFLSENPPKSDNFPLARDLWLNFMRSFADRKFDFDNTTEEMTTTDERIKELKADTSLEPEARRDAIRKRRMQIYIGRVAVVAEEEPITSVQQDETGAA